jgi:MoxR-like ATPase
MSDILQFVGDGERHTTTPYKDAPAKSEPYIAEPALVNAINMALQLRRPLLLEGDPGGGKTRLAYAVAYELGYPINECYIRSTSRARDLLYTYDAMRRLYEVQMAVAWSGRKETFFEDGKPNVKPEDFEDKFKPDRYVKYGSLGLAIMRSAVADKPSVVLIDEIDKAEFDFPNDLLQVLEELRFSVDEAPELSYNALQGKTREDRTDKLPLFIITSNRERELPRAFLRRCLYYYIDFPNSEALKNIIERHFDRGITPLFLAAVKRFWQLREAEDFSWRKPPSTSELLDWLRVLEIAEQRGQVSAEQLEQLPLPALPFLETLIKTQSDRLAINNSAFSQGNMDSDDGD